VLVRVKFTVAKVASGGTADLLVEWQSTLPTQLHLNFDAGAFAMDPSSIDLDASPGKPTTETRQVTITRLATGPSHCDVHFVQGAFDKLSSVEVV
jgi:hypothetical protein